MSLFGKILAKLGFGHDTKDESVSAAPVSSAQVPAIAVPQVPNNEPVVVAISEVDVVANLEALAESHAEKLNWKVSIVDLLKLLELESSLSARKELAQELGCPTEKMGDSASMNIWLHKTVLQKIAQNGGNIPAELLG